MGSWFHFYKTEKRRVAYRGAQIKNPIKNNSGIRNFRLRVLVGALHSTLQAQCLLRHGVPSRVMRMRNLRDHPRG